MGIKQGIQNVLTKLSKNSSDESPSIESKLLLDYAKQIYDHEGIDVSLTVEVSKNVTKIVFDTDNSYYRINVNPSDSDNEYRLTGRVNNDYNLEHEFSTPEEIVDYLQEKGEFE